MSFSYSAGVITQTGTDTSLAGLNGLTGVTRTQSDRDAGASNWYTIYTIDAATQLRVTGTLTIDPDIESLIIEGEAASGANAPFYVNGGTVNFGVARTGNGNTVYSEGIGLQFTKEGANFFNVDGLYVDGTGTWIWNGGIIRSAATITFGDGATLTVNSGTFFSVATVNTMQVRCEANDATASSNINIYNLTLAGLTGPSRIFTLWAFGTAVFTLKRGEFQPLNPMDTPITLTDFNNSSNVNDADIAFETQNGSNALTITVQNAFQEVITRDINVDRYGYVEVFRQLDSPIVDLNGSSISYSYYGVDTNNGNRGVGAAGQDRTADEVYSGINATGNLSENILVNVIRDISGTITVDDRTDAGGNITIRVVGYGENIAAFNPTLYGIGSNTETAILTPDLIITESVKATVDAYTSIDTAQQLYDRAKSYLYDNYAGEAAPIVGRSGEQILLEGKTLTIDGTAVSAFAYADPAITIHSDTFTGGATATTGSVTTVNGALLDGGTFDCDVNYQSGAGTTLNNVTVNGTLDFSVAGTYTLNGCTITEVTNSSGGAVTLVADASTTITTNTGPNITISAPVLTLTVNSSETGSLIQVFNAGTTTVLASATSNTLDYQHSNETVDIVVQKAGFIPQRQTGIDLSGASSTVSVTLVEDLNYLSGHGLTYSTDYTINMAAGEIDVLNPAIGREVYSAVIDSFITGDGDTENKDFPLSMNGPRSLILNDIEFTSTSIANLSQTGFRYVASGSLAAVYSAVQTTTQPAGTKIWRLSSDGGTWTLQDTGTGFDGIVQVFGDATHGNFDNRNFLTFKATNDGYTVDEWNVISDGGVAEVVDGFYFVPLTIVLTGEATGDPSVTGVTVTNIVDTVWNGITVGVTVEVDAGVSGSDVLRYLTWERHQGNLLDFGQLVESLGDDYKSVRGRVYDGTPLDVEGVRVVLSSDGTTPHPDFSTFEGDSGTYTPPVSVSGTVNITQAGSRVQIFNVTTDTELFNGIVAGTSTALTQLTSSATYWSPSDVIRVRVTYQNGLVAMQKASSTLTVGGSEEWSLTITQEACPTYDAYGIDGSTVTEFAWDGTNVQFDINDPDNIWYVNRLFAWDKYYTFTEVGIREAFEYISAIDAGNIRIDNAAALDNLKAQTAIQGDNVRLFRPDGTLPVVNPTTGGGGLTFYSTGTIFIAETGTSGLTPAESATLNQLNGTLDANIVEVNSIPVTGSGTTGDPWGP